MLFCGEPHALDEVLRLVEGKLLRLVMYGHRGQVRVDEIDASAVEDDAIGSDRHEHRPAGVVRHTDHRAVSRHRLLTFWREPQVRSTRGLQRSESARLCLLGRHSLAPLSLFTFRTPSRYAAHPAVVDRVIRDSEDSRAE